MSDELKDGDWVVPVEGPEGEVVRKWTNAWPLQALRDVEFFKLLHFVDDRGNVAWFYASRFRRVDPPASAAPAPERRPIATWIPGDEDEDDICERTCPEYLDMQARAERAEELLKSCRAQSEAHLAARLRAEAELEHVQALRDLERKNPLFWRNNE